MLFNARLLTVFAALGQGGGQWHVTQQVLQRVYGQRLRSAARACGQPLRLHLRYTEVPIHHGVLIVM